MHRNTVVARLCVAAAAVAGPALAGLGATPDPARFLSQPLVKEI